MSKKGQDNQRGISFQNKVALLYLLDHYRYANFTEIKFEGDKFEDFSLFFTDPINRSSFFHNFEVKNWSDPLSLAKVKEIIKKEVKKGIKRYSDKSKFFIVAPSFTEDCEKIESFKEKYFFNSEKDFETTKKIYQKIYGNDSLFNWIKEEILFLKYVHLVELKKENIDDKIIDRFYYEDSFFYTEDSVENIISRFLRKIADGSSYGRNLKKGEIQNILSEFHSFETQKSESYNLEQDLGSVIGNIETKLETENEFTKLSHDRYITPISCRPKAILYMSDKLKQKQFKLENIKWFFEKILIKKYYFFQCLDLLEGYIQKNHLAKEDINLILEVIFKIYERSSPGSNFQKFGFNSYSNKRIFNFLLQICNKQKISDQFKDKIICFLDNQVPVWQKEHRNSFDDDYNYQDIPRVVEIILSYSKEGLDFLFKKYDFTKFHENLTEYNHSYYNYIEKFINKDFKTNFPLVIKNMSSQFQDLYKSYGYDPDFYKGYEMIGGGYSGFGNNYNLHVLPLESVLSRCICHFYNKNKDWKCLSSFIFSECNRDNPIFVKRSFIPFLLNQLKKPPEERPEDNGFYKALVFILKIEKGLPFTEDVFINELRHIHSSIKNCYLEKLLKIILYKHSKEGISYSILIIQFLFQLIESGRLNFKSYLKKILLNETFKKHYIYDQALGLFDSKITNRHINDFFNEIKNELDISKSNDLIYRSVILDLQTSSFERSKLSKLFNSSSEKDLNCLASIIEKDLWNTKNPDFLKKVLKFMKNDLDLEGFYERAKVSEYLKKVIIQLVERAISYDADLSERIIELCINDTYLCEESKKLHDEVAKGGMNLIISTMRAHLCHTINQYIINYSQKTDKKSIKNIEKAFSWVKLLVDLDGSLAYKIEDFPRPNYYLRVFAITPLISLAHPEIRNKLNDFKIGLGDEIKKLAFAIIEKTKKEIEESKYTPYELFKKISFLFNYMKDLDKEEAKKFLSFIECFRVKEANCFFIYYALFREKYFKEKGIFESDIFKKMLIRVCKSEPDQLKYSLSFTIYKAIKTKRKNGELKPDFEFFESIKNYWILLFEKMDKNMFFPLLMTLSFVLKNKRYYNNYKKYFFQLIKKILENRENSNDWFIHLDVILPAISENNPDDLAEILFLFLKKGDSARGYIPFSYEVRQHLIPEINRVKNKISQEKMCKVKAELKKYNGRS